MMDVTRSHQDLVRKSEVYFFANHMKKHTIHKKADFITLRCEIRSAFIMERFHFYLAKNFICAKLIVE